MKIVIIGGVAGGATAAARLRRLDEGAQIILIERGQHISFANCGLPYYIGGVISDRQDLLLQTPASFSARFRADVRINSEVTFIDHAKRLLSVRNERTGAEYTESYDKLILSPGGSPIVPPMEGLDTIDAGRVFTLRSVADADRVKDCVSKNHPQSVAVVGGGFIGVEMAENLRELGLDVAIIELSDQVLAPIDPDMACDVHRHLREKGVSLRLNDSIQKIAQADGKLQMQLKNAALEADMLVLAIGVRPESQLAKEAGLALNQRGGIVADKHMLTSDPDIYAVGDAVEVTDFVTGQTAMVPLAGPANKQGRIAADNLCGIPSEYGGTQGSAVLRVFDLTVASTGVNEKTARRLGLDYDKIFLWTNGHTGYYPGSRQMSMKVLFEKGTGKILGGQIVGYDGVDKRCDVLAVAIRAGMTAHDLTQLELCYAPPYSSAKDPVNMAGYVIENELSGLVKNFHWHEVDGLPRDGSVQLVDVRDADEVAEGQIEGFVNIPVNSLRERMGELDKSLPIYLHCHSGQRSYLAARILAQNGFEAYNLSGGYRLYSANQ